MLDEIIFVIVSIFIIAIIVICSTFSHEDVHLQAYANDGVPATIGFDWTQLRAYTSPDKNTWAELPVEDKRFLRLENSINESVAYNTTGYFVGAILTLVFGFLYIGSKIDKIVWSK
jgi:hypothetical protein